MIGPLDASNQTAALTMLRRSPYRNALPLANASQLRALCDVLVATDGEQVVGVASTYHSLPIPNLTFATDRQGATLGPLLHLLAERNERLQHGPVYALLPQQRLAQLAKHAAILDYEIEYQMVVEPETLRAPANPVARRLGAADAGRMSALALAAGLGVWHEGALQLGPAFGCFDGDQLVAMAATHFATPEVVEIGHIATHPAYRRRGLASACTAALAQAAFGLASRVFLMVLENNSAARAMYRRLGFYPTEPFYMTRCTLNKAH